MANRRLQKVDRKAIEAAARDLIPTRIKAWAVVIGLIEFPVKQIVREAANRLEMDEALVTPADFTAHQAVAILRRADLADSIRYGGERVSA